MRSLGWLSWALCSGVSHKGIKVLARSTVSSEAQLEKDPLLRLLRLLAELTFLGLQNWEILSLAGCWLKLLQVTGWRPLSGSQSHFQCLATWSFPTWPLVSSEPARETASNKKGSFLIMSSKLSQTHHHMHTFAILFVGSVGKRTRCLPFQ